jgi:enolase-phosphatase E1
MKAIVLDIEGTVTDKRFVTETLFPFARAALPDFLRANESEYEVAAALKLMRAKLKQPKATRDEIAAALISWIDEDRKEEPLKTLQGLIWRAGYDDGRLVSHIYEDVPPALARWLAAGLTIAIYSSGSVAAQKLLFARTVAGDLTAYLAHHFDLGVGLKTDPQSYLRIAKSLDCPPADILFYSDAPKEIVAATKAGLETVLVERDGPIDAPMTWRRIPDFSEERP